MTFKGPLQFKQFYNKQGKSLASEIASAVSPLLDEKKNNELLFAPASLLSVLGFKFLNVTSVLVNTLCQQG